MSEPPMPFQTFNFRIALRIPGDAGDVCSADFWECDGLEITMAPKTIREGGNNGAQVHLLGPVSYGQLTLKRGMTADQGIWSWFERLYTDGQGGLRADGRVEILSTLRASSGGQSAGNLPAAEAAFALTGCLPIKLRAPSLSGKDGAIAVEELQLAYETLRRAPVNGRGV